MLITSECGCVAIWELQKDLDVSLETDSLERAFIKSQYQPLLQVCLLSKNQPAVPSPVWSALIQIPLTVKRPEALLLLTAPGPMPAIVFSHPVSVWTAFTPV